MPPRGVKRTTRTRQNECIKESAEQAGRSAKAATPIAAGTTNKTRREEGKTTA